MLQYYYRTEINQRPKNEDAVGFEKIPIPGCTQSLWVLIVSDGMGEGCAGEVYSRMTVQEMLTSVKEMIAQLQNPPSDRRVLYPEEVSRQIMQRLPETTGDINRRVISTAREQGLAGGGATLAVALVTGDRLVTCNVGDSPIYLFSDGQARELSIRDNMAEELVRRGEISRSSYEYAEHSSELTAFIGSKSELDFHLSMTLLSDGDTVILGSDGAFGDMTGAEDVTAELASVPPSRYADRLCAASEAATYDNQTVIAATYTAEKLTLFDRIRKRR